MSQIQVASVTELSVSSTTTGCAVSPERVTQERAQAVRSKYSSASNRAVERLNRNVYVGQSDELRPAASRYQLRQPPAFQTVPWSRRWIWSLNLVTTGAFTSTDVTPRAAIVRSASSRYVSWASIM